MKIGAITLTLAFSMAFAFLVLAGIPPASDAGPCPSTLEVAAGNADDGIGDCVDNCTEATNALQIDTDSDGYGNMCDPDVTNTDGVVGVSDLGLLKKSFLVAVPPGNPNLDFDSDCVIGGSDLGILKKKFLSTPGPSGLPCAGNPPCPAGGGVPTPCV